LDMLTDSGQPAGCWYHITRYDISCPEGISTHPEIKLVIFVLARIAQNMRGVHDVYNKVS